MEIIKVNGSALYQWDTDRTVEITPWQNFTVDEVHFMNPNGDTAFVVKPIIENEEVVAPIPNILLQTTVNIRVFAIMHTDNGERTVSDCTFGVNPRQKPSDYVYTETEVWSYKVLEDRMKALEDNLDKQVASSIEDYLKENPIDGLKFETDHTLKLENGVLSVNTTDQMEQDNTLPITSAGVYATVGNIEALLKTI